MSNLIQPFVDEIVQNCFELFNDIPKSGKPIEKEWTVLSCFIKYDKSNEKTEVVSLGTGSKCIGASKMCPKGTILNDSHAEIFARRGFLLYLYENISEALKKGESLIFINDNNQMKLKDNIQFIFYSSQLPCGDASIIPKSGKEEQYGHVLQSQKRAASEEICDIQSKKQKLDDDIYRTGAKCLPHCEQDTKEAGSKYHLVGQVRTKPGKGDRTLSVSCSDKIAKWMRLGVQGSLIDMMCDPIYIQYFIFGAGVPFSKESLHRALFNRNSEFPINLNVEPEIYQTTLVFPHVRNEDNIRPAAGSIVWINSYIQSSEVAAQGKKLGVTKRKALLASNSLCISKYNIYKKFIKILNQNPSLKKKVCSENDIENIPYNEMKRKSERYIEKWLEVKNTFFKSWTVKPDMWGFCINDVSL